MVFVFWFWFGPENIDVGYQPVQPIPFSHRLHAGEMGIDCRYCHFNVERSSAATIPTTEVCMNCHSVVKKDSPLLKPLRDSMASGKPIQWVKVHRLPDYAYFDHSRHIHGGVSCVVCHGRVDQMDVVHQVKPLSMGWCLDCHRNPAPNLRPASVITQMDWKADNQVAIGLKLMEEKHIHPGEDCSVCHR